MHKTFFMKKLILILAMVFSAAILSPLSAQISASDFQFGFRVAPNIGWLKPDAEGYTSKGIRAGFNWGFVAEYRISENVRLQSGFNILMNGGKLEYPHQVTTDSIIEKGSMLRRYSFKYIEIPFLIKLTTNEIGYFRYYGIIGLGTGFNIAAKAVDEFSTETPSERLIKGEPKIKSSTRFVREALVVGLGAQYNFSGTTDLIFGINFNNGFTNALKGKNKVSSVSETAISNFLELNIGVLF